MLSLELSEFLVQLKEGTINNVGAPTKSATVKLFDVATAEARAFGDNRVKLAFADEDGNEIEIALFPDAIKDIEEDLTAVRSSGIVEGFSPETK